MRRRINEHLLLLRKGKHYNNYFQNAWNKYGEDKFSWCVLEKCEVNLLQEREKFWINKYNSFKNGFNLTSGGERIGEYQISEETREKRRIKMSGENNHMYNRRHTEEAIEINRQAHTGKNSSNARPVICIETNEFFWSGGEAARAKNGYASNINKVCRGVSKDYHGTHWRYATNEEIEFYNNIVC